MNLDKVQLKLKVRRIIRREPINGPDLFDLYLSIFSIYSQKSKLKEHPVIGPSACVTEDHFVPTTKGFKAAKDIRVGDIILGDISLVEKLEISQRKN